MDKKSLRLLRKRDTYCWHCGIDDDTLVPHHRLNRGMGGSKALDNLANVILVCSRYNQQIEDFGFWAARAREHGHKLVMGQAPDVMPCFDSVSGVWFRLGLDGSKVDLEDL